jgi:aspartate kinase
MIVMKFGGSSVANRGQIEKVLHIVKEGRDRDPIVVCSAHKGITNLLISCARAAAKGEYDPDAIIDRQAEIAAELGCADDLLMSFYAEIRDLLRGIQLVKELSPRSLDYISSFGERMSVRCIADFLTRHGVEATAHDVWDLGFITDSNFGNARPLPGQDSAMKAAFAELPRATVPIITGFVGKNEAGEVTTVGRNGSDLTATLLAAALGAQEVQIWTDTDGVMTADPSVVDQAHNIPVMRFDEAAELAYFGSRVLHPSTLLPAMHAHIPVRVLNTNRPEHHGTVIEEDAAVNPASATSIAYKEKQIAVTVTSTRMFGRAGILAEIFGVLGAHGVVVDLIATSEISVSLTACDAEPLERAIADLERVGEVEVRRNKTILVVVGRHLSERPGLGAQILGAVANAGVNIELISYGLGSINFSMLIDDGDIERAVAVLHEMLFSE